MSKHASTTEPTSAAAVTSPKVKAAGWASAAVVVLGTALAAGIAAIPRDAFDNLGTWALPVGVFVGALGTGISAVIAAYQKGDSLRNLGAAIADQGGVAPAPPEEPVVALEPPAELAQYDDSATPAADRLLAELEPRTGSTTTS